METVPFFSKTRNPLVGAETFDITAKVTDLSDEFQIPRVVAFLNPKRISIVPASRS